MEVNKSITHKINQVQNLYHSMGFSALEFDFRMKVVQLDITSSVSVYSLMVSCNMF